MLCACGLDKNGLFELAAEAPDPAGSTGDVEFVGVLAPEAGGDSEVDAKDAWVMPVDGTTRQAEAAPMEAASDAKGSDQPVVVGDGFAGDGFVDDGFVNDGFVGDGFVGDGFVGDGFVGDGFVMPSSLPIVYDGGYIVDPQFSDSDWTAFCIALVACGQMPSISACVALLRQPSAPDALIPPPHLVNSVNNAGSDCMSIGQLLGDGSTCPTTTEETCAGSSLVTCRWGFRMTVDCSPLGMVCSMGNGNAGCGFGDCSPTQEGKAYCVGPSELVECNRGRYSPIQSCQTFGGSCGGPAETASCVGTGGSGCSGSAVCNGTSIVECLGGLLGSVDCSTLYGSSFTCILGSTGNPACAAGTACDPTTNVDTCVGNKVSFCNAGAKASYDCSGSGWAAGCRGGHCAP
jgi:hypothetical protein